MKDNNDYQTFPPVCFQARSRFTVFKLLIPFIKGWRFKKKKKSIFSRVLLSSEAGVQTVSSCLE